MTEVHGVNLNTSEDARRYDNLLGVIDSVATGDFSRRANAGGNGLAWSLVRARQHDD
ncbi:MAG: hypothetical protein QM784_38270 [Polyangiaceae bacterium]